MITYDDLVKPLDEGGHYEFSRETIRRFLELVQPTDRALLYQCKMLDSSEIGRSALAVAGPGRTILDADDAPQTIGDLPSRFKELEGEVDIDSLQTGMEGYEPPSLEKVVEVIRDTELGHTLWECYQANVNDMPASAYTDGAKKKFEQLKLKGLIQYNRSRRGWGLTNKAWNAIEG